MSRAGARFTATIGAIALTFALVSTLGSPAVAVDSPTWVKATPASAPSPRQSPGMAYDPAIGKLVLFGGLGDHNRDAETWTWDGSTWQKLSPAVSPRRRNLAALAYDPDTGQLVLFGGADMQQGYIGDTWTFDGSTWTKQHQVGEPGGWCRGVMAWDPATSQLILFGFTKVPTTWTWDGAAWTNLRPATQPTTGCGASLAFDTATNQLVLFGGFDPSAHLYNDTWTWDGTTWSKLSPTTQPAARIHAAMGYSAATGQLVLFGGDAEGDHPDLGDTWSWDGTNWNQLEPAKSPSGRSVAAMAYDDSSGQLVLFGGYRFARPGNLNDTWIWR